MEKRYRVTLTESEQSRFTKLVSVGKAAAQKLVRARILLLADQAEGGSSEVRPGEFRIGVLRSIKRRTRSQTVC